MRRLGLVIAVAMVASLAAVPHTGWAKPVANEYTAVDLGTLGGDYSRAMAVNDSDFVTGQAVTANGETHAFLWHPDTGMVDLGTLGGDFSTGEAINNQGQVAGSSLSSDGPFERAFLWDSSTGMTDLGTLGKHARAYGINDSGQVTGTSMTVDNEWHAFFWDPSTGMIDLGNFGGIGAVGVDLNAAGQVVGRSAATDGSNRAFLWDPLIGAAVLGTLGGVNAQGEGINDAGQMAGTIWFADRTGPASCYPTAPGGCAFLRDPDGSLTYLGHLGGGESYGLAINNHGQVAGQASLSSPSVQIPKASHAFIWSASSGMIDLGTLGGDHSRANDLSNIGTLVGYAETADGSTHATMWARVDLGWIQGLIDSFDGWVEEGTLYASGGIGNLKAYRNLLTNVAKWLEDGLIDQACLAINRAVEYADGVANPDDWVEGPSIGALLEALQAEARRLGCV